ncbi:bifunctional uridylyltransferase/uridylyl-removing protein GlnD, partial [Kaarinaea lacus]
MISPTSGLCDWQQFDAELAKASQPLSLFRDAISCANGVLAQRFEQQMPVADLVKQRAGFIDQLLHRAWQQFFKNEPDDIALIAVGGYGRGELHPASDIDLLILLSNDQSQERATSIEQFLLLLWDMSLDIGHSVRTIEQCVEHCTNDITIATTLMEARLICGPQELFDQLQHSNNPEQVWPSRDFFQAKIEEQIARHHRFGDTAYNLEPNIKENPGGLRDIQTIGWVAKRHFGATTLRDLVDHSFLTEAECDLLEQSQIFLWKIRFGLHLLAKRKEDRLLFDYQRTLSKQLGYKDSEHRLGVEKFMKDYYSTVMELTRLNEMLLQLFDEEILLAHENKQANPINRRFKEQHGFIEAANPKLFKRYPFALLEIFLILAQHPELKGVRAETIRLIRDHRYLINDKFRNDLRCQSLFMELFRQPRGLTHELRRMYRYGVLAAYLPEFDKIV